MPLKKKNWKRTINIKDKISADNSKRYVQISARQIFDQLKAELPDYPNLEDFNAIIQKPDSTQLNAALKKLYDWGDSKGIWFGL